MSRFKTTSTSDNDATVLAVGDVEYAGARWLTALRACCGRSAQCRTVWRLALARRSERVSFALGLEAVRSESTDDEREPEDRIGLRLAVRWQGRRRRRRGRCACLGVSEAQPRVPGGKGGKGGVGGDRVAAPRRRAGVDAARCIAHSRHVSRHGRGRSGATRTPRGFQFPMTAARTESPNVRCVRPRPRFSRPRARRTAPSVPGRVRRTPRGRNGQSDPPPPSPRGGCTSAVPPPAQPPRTHRAPPR